MEVARVAAGMSVAGFAVASVSGVSCLAGGVGVAGGVGLGLSDGVAGNTCAGGSRAPAGHHLLGHHVGHLAPAAHHLNEVIGGADGVGVLGEVSGVWYVEDAGD